jgi:septal ring factor EnvC (AmiA/AmiB activator)
MTAWRMMRRRLICTTMAVALRPCRIIATGFSHAMTMWKRTWAVLAPSASDPTMDTTVRHLSAMQEANEALKEEVRAAQKSEKRLQKQIDEMAIQLG